MRVRDILVVVSLLFLVGCSSEKDKLTGLWIASDYKVSGDWKVDQSQHLEFEFFSDGTFEYRQGRRLGPDGQDRPEAIWEHGMGRWVVLDDGRLKMDVDDEIKVWEIEFVGELLQMSAENIFVRCRRAEKY